MNVLRALIPIFCLSILFGASSAFAQVQVDRPDLPPTALAAGAHSLSFGVPGGGNPYAPGTLGYWIMVAPEINVGINVGFALDRRTVTVGAEEETRTSWDVLLAPAVKFYTSRLTTVAPYYFAQVNLRFHDDGIDATDEDLEMGLALGLGAEWFPVPNFSIGGHVGIGVDVLRPGNAEPVALGTFTSGLSAQIYF
ncbi:MAG: hypothetical protein ACNA8W_25015 [Bradymonadaceae bacterium]